MIWSIIETIPVTQHWVYTPVVNGTYFRLLHIDAPFDASFDVCQAEKSSSGYQIFEVKEYLGHLPLIVYLSKPAIFSNRMIGIRSNAKNRRWQIKIEVSDYVEPNVNLDLSPIQTKLDEISNKIDNIQSSGGTTEPNTQGKVLTYAFDGDTNGVFYYLGTNKNTTIFSNPAPNLVAVTLSMNSIYGKPEGITDRGNEIAHTQDEPNSWIAVDFKTGTTLKCNYYSIRARSENTQNIRSFKLQASNDFVSWDDLDSRTNQTQLVSNLWASYPVVSNNFYRYFRILQTGVNQSGQNFLVLNELELYGTLTTP